MAATPPAEPTRPSPNTVMRALRGDRSPGEFATAVRRAAREIGEHVSCDARYVGRVESGEIRCPNYAYERVFRHMWPGRSLTDLGFSPRTAVRRRPADGDGSTGAPPLHQTFPTLPAPRPPLSTQLPYAASPYADPPAPDGSPRPGAVAVHRGRAGSHHLDEENDDVRRRTFLAGGSAALATVIGIDRPAGAATGSGPGSGSGSGSGSATAPGLFGPVAAFVPGRPGPVPPLRRVGAAEVLGVEQAIRDIRLADDAHGGDALFELAGQSLRNAYALLNEGEYNAETERRLQAGAGELAISVGWLAHDSNRLADARSLYAEALATARMAGDSALEAHVFSNSAFLARDAGRPREALRAAQAGQAAARYLDSDRLLALLAMREAGGWAMLQDRASCERALVRAYTLFERGPSEADPEWMSFFGEAEIAGLQSQCWSALGDWDRAGEQAMLAMALQEPHFVRNRVLYTAELAHDRLGRGDLAGAAHHGSAAVALFGEVRSARIRSMLADTAERLRPHATVPEVGGFLTAYDLATAA
ncbi:tetratricopeptide repeat protein [Streptomyces kaniharaensis]|uniref:Tetratricopeptide repeat protein n=1 Tax=Streptomyces kaniharaensis TaxID=212423 RepID=A0A6N7KLE8_9ACTN|nr:tetratricopeptide repeat protein [Streptomyces kaniharaensis]MQS12342.1 tetratricopeptide repeat protein [Streptomyces kaniharaensis]